MSLSLRKNETVSTSFHSRSVLFAGGILGLVSHKILGKECPLLVAAARPQIVCHLIGTGHICHFVGENLIIMGGMQTTDTSGNVNVCSVVDMPHMSCILPLTQAFQGSYASRDL